MKIAEQILAYTTDQHTEGSHRIEDTCAYHPPMADRVGQLALRFIAVKGLSEEFADALDEIMAIESRQEAECDADPSL